MTPLPKTRTIPLMPVSDVVIRKSHHVGDAADGLGVQHDDLGGDVSLHGLRHVLHRAVDGGVFDLEPVVCVPADQEPHILLPVELLLEHLQQGGEGRRICGPDEGRARNDK